MSPRDDHRYSNERQDRFYDERSSHYHKEERESGGTSGSLTKLGQDPEPDRGKYIFVLLSDPHRQYIYVIGKLENVQKSNSLCSVTCCCLLLLAYFKEGFRFSNFEN